MNPRWLLRMALWARNPASAARVKLVFAIVFGALVIFSLEHFGFWPEALTAERMRP
ncbi:MAG: hypothetical protein PVI41_12745 [Roseobacter sp.]|jgi:hypothetical protein